LGRVTAALNYLGFDFVLKGRGFQPRRKCHKIDPALAAEGVLSLQRHFSHTLLSRTFQKSCALHVFASRLASEVTSETYVSLRSRSLCDHNIPALN